MTERIQSQSDTYLQIVLDASSDAIVVLGEDLRVQWASGSVERLSGWTTGELHAIHPMSLIHPDDMDVAVDNLQAVLAGAVPELHRTQCRLRRRDGGWRWTEISGRDLRHVEQIRGIVLSVRDTTEEHRVHFENRMLLEVFDLTDDVAVLLDPNGKLLHLNDAAKRFRGLDDEAATQAIGGDWYPDAGTMDDVIQRIITAPREFVRWSGEVEAERPDGTKAAMIVQLIAHRDTPDGPIRFFSAVGRDITERKALEASLKEQATHDPLTSLPNRSLLLDRIGRALDGLRGVGSTRTVALLFIDIDHFKHVNDSMGHELGDQILREVAQRISGVVRPGDTVARFGGDEFVVLCERMDHVDDAVVVAHRIDQALAAPVRVADREIRLGVSIGISYADGEDPDVSSVLRDADTAMYQAKAAGRGRRVVFDETLRRRAEARSRVETSLRSTRHGEELEVHYQPVLDLATRRIAGVEALVRWRHHGALVDPSEFVPVAEETGLIVPIGAWVLRTACEQVGRWQGSPGWSHLRLAVNVSARQLQHPDFVDLVADVLETSAIAAETLWIEITESVLLDDLQASSERLDQLTGLGVRIALDDFGTGYSSLTYLRRFPADAVKLDRSFVDGIEVDSGDTAIVTAVINLATALGKECVAEGIETEAQFAALAALGCATGQGYLFSAPVPPDELAELLDRDEASGCRR